MKSRSLLNPRQLYINALTGKEERPAFADGTVLLINYHINVIINLNKAF